MEHACALVFGKLLQNGATVGYSVRVIVTWTKWRAGKVSVVF